MRPALLFALTLLGLTACSLPPADAGYAPYENMVSPTTQFGGGAGGGGAGGGGGGGAGSM